MRGLAALLAAAAVVAVALPTRSQGLTVRYAGQLLDLRNGYVFFSSGESFRLAEAWRLADYDSGEPTTLTVRPRMWARAVLDPKTKSVVELDITTHKIPLESSPAAVAGLAVSQSSPVPAEELNPPADGRAPSGKSVPVTFEVTVPATTPLDADIYISTDVSNWDPKAIKANRIDGIHYRVQREFNSGTRFAFRITRGTTSSVEIGQNGLEQPPHRFSVREVDAQVSRVTVFGWSDQRGNNANQAQPGAIQTPFNPNPFPGGPGSLFPPSRATPPGGGPTPAGGNPNLPPQH